MITGQKIGYARVSSKDQNLDRQTTALKKEKVFRIFTDTVSGSSTQRGLSSKNVRIPKCPLSP
ncbi:recombinase family protein [Corynebacterium diphtheriae]|nr:recombinase family protein [Corynebacterium diphtheriae]AEX47227.1 DNA-invertase [Corynebacterium diphtheriae INCA 402]